MGDSVPLKQDGRFRIINARLFLIEIESKEIKVRVSELEKRQRVTSDEILNNEVTFVLEIKVECFSLCGHIFLLKIWQTTYMLVLVFAFFELSSNLGRFCTYSGLPS